MATTKTTRHQLDKKGANNKTRSSSKILLSAECKPASWDTGGPCSSLIQHTTAAMDSSHKEFPFLWWVFHNEIKQVQAS